MVQASDLLDPTAIYITGTYTHTARSRAKIRSSFFPAGRAAKGAQSFRQRTVTHFGRSIDSSK